MSAVDLSALPAPDVLEALDYEAIYAEILAEFREAMGDAWDATLESDPVVKQLELAAYRKMQSRARVNDAARALMLPFSKKADLEQLAARVNLQRLVVRAADDTVVPPITEVLEEDDALRERIQLSYEGLTTAGPRQSYIFHARNASGQVADATAESPSPATVVVTVLALEGDGVASAALLESVEAYLSDENRRPVADRLTVQSASVLPYRIDAVLHMEGVGAENEPAFVEAQSRLEAWINPRKRLGVEIARSAIDAELHVSGVRRVDLTNWVDIVPDPSQAAYCTGFSIVRGG